MTVSDEAEKLENRSLINTYITVDFIKTIYEISFKKKGLDHVEIRGPTLNYFSF